MAGTYLAKAKSTDVGYIGHNGNAAISVVWETVGSEKKKRFRSEHFLTDASIEWTINAMRTAGWKGSDLGDFSQLNDASYMMPNEVELVTEDQEYEKNGEIKTAERVKFVNAAGGTIARIKDQIPPDAFSRLSAKFAAMAGTGSVTAKENKSEFDPSELDEEFGKPPF